MITFQALKEKIRSLLRKPLGQALSAAAVGLLVSIFAGYAALMMVRPNIAAIRAGVMLAYARILQSHPRELAETKTDVLPRLAEAFGSFSFSIWLVDGEGTVVSSTEPELLPVDWKLIPKDTEEYSIRWVPETGYFHMMDAVAAVRLVSQPERHLVFRFLPRSNAPGRSAMFVMWMVLNLVILSMATFVFFNARRRRESAV